MTFIKKLNVVCTQTTSINLKSQIVSTIALPGFFGPPFAYSRVSVLCPGMKNCLQKHKNDTLMFYFPIIKFYFPKSRLYDQNVN